MKKEWKPLDFEIFYCLSLMEIFKDIPGYEGFYQCSNYGRVKSLKFNKQKILIPQMSGNKNKQYYTVRLYSNKKQNSHYIHQLVAITFLNHNSSGHKIVVDHKDGNKLNNKLDNIQIITQRENASKDRKNKSGLTAVRFCTVRKMYCCYIWIGTKRIWLGGYTDDKYKLSKIYEKAVELLDLYNGNNIDFRKLIHENLK